MIFNLYLERGGIMRNKSLTISMILVLLSMFISKSEAKDYSKKSEQTNISIAGAVNPQYTLSNINNWSYWLYHNGKSASNPYTGGSGAVYPRNTAGAICRDGIVWGAQINGNIRVGGQTYREGTQALSDHIYRIRKNWSNLTTANVKEETAEFYNISIDAVTDEQANQIIEQYKNDWKNWPYDLGAPYVDVDGNGIYNPVLDNDGMPDASLGDYPGIHNADQVIWFRSDDQSTSLTQNFYGSDPMGVELQVTVWAYDQPDSRLGQAIY